MFVPDSVSGNFSPYQILSMVRVRCLLSRFTEMRRPSLSNGARQQIHLGRNNVRQITDLCKNFPEMTRR